MCVCFFLKGKSTAPVGATLYRECSQTSLSRFELSERTGERMSSEGKLSEDAAETSKTALVPGQPRLPWGWTEKQDSDGVFYYAANTGETSYDLPTEPKFAVKVPFQTESFCRS